MRCWNRLCSEDAPVLLRHAILHQKHLLEKGKQCWLTKVQAIFEGAGFASTFTYNGCDKELTNLIMLRYRDQYIQSWYQKLHTTTSTRGSGGNKLRTYQLLKSKFEQEPYLSIVANVKHRVVLTRLRLSCHRLEIEVGRYHKPIPIPVPLRLVGDARWWKMRYTSFVCVPDSRHYVRNFLQWFMLIIHLSSGSAQLTSSYICQHPQMCTFYVNYLLLCISHLNCIRVPLHDK